MSMSSRLTDAFARIGSEFKSVRGAIALKYTKPPGGIPLEDLSTGVTTAFTPSWANIPDIPAEFNPTQHDHVITEVTGLGTALNGKVNSPPGINLSTWVGTVSALPTTKSSSTIYFAW